MDHPEKYFPRMNWLYRAFGKLLQCASTWVLVDRQLLRQSGRSGSCFPFSPHIRSIWEFAGDHPLDGFAQIHLETPEIQILEESIHQPDLLVIRRSQERPRVGVIQSQGIKFPGWLGLSVCGSRPVPRLISVVSFGSHCRQNRAS